MTLHLDLFFKLDQLLQAEFFDLLSGDQHSMQRCKSLISRLSAHEQKTWMYSLVRILSKQHLLMEGPSQNLMREGQKRAVGGVASLLGAIVGDVSTLQDNLVEWLIGVSADAVGHVHNAHRAVIAAFSSIPGSFMVSSRLCT